MTRGIYCGKGRTESNTLFEISRIAGRTGLTDGNCASLRDEFDVIKTDITSMRNEGKSTREADKIFDESCRLLEVLIVILLEKTTKKTSKNSSIPSSQTDKDEAKKSPKRNRDTSEAENSMTGENFKTIIVEEISTVEVCDSCCADLSDIDPSAREQRVLLDIEYTVKKLMLSFQTVGILHISAIISP